MSYDGLQNLNDLSVSTPLDSATTAELLLAIREIKLVLKNVLLQAHKPNGALREIAAATIAGNAVGTNQLIDLAVTAAKLADLSVGTSKIILESITSALLADNAVTFGKIGPEAIGAESYRTNSIPLSALAGGLTSANIGSSATVDADRAIGSNHIKNLAVLDRAIAAMAVTKLTGGTAGQIAVRGASGWSAVTPLGGLTYDAITGLFSIESPATSAYFGDVKSRGVEGGGTTAGVWAERDLGEIEDGRNLMVFTGNTFRLIQGSYFIYARCPAAGAVGKHQARLWRTLNGANIDIPLWGASEQCGAGNSNASIVQGTLVVNNDTTTFKLQHWFQNTVAASGLGTAASSDNTVVYANHSEVYTTGYILKLT